jgi:hypothetical protein
MTVTQKRITTLPLEKVSFLGGKYGSYSVSFAFVSAASVGTGRGRA